MLEGIFYWVLNMSIIGFAAGIIILIIRCIKILPRFGIYFLWVLPLIRFWIPVGFANKYSLLNLVSQHAVKTITVWEPITYVPNLTMSNSVQAVTEYFPMEYKTDILKNIFNIAGIVWVSVAIVAVLISLLFYILTKYSLRNAKHIKDNIYCSDKLLSPAVYGILKPKIMLPTNFNEANLEYIIRHEQIHIRRLDNLWRLIAIITACIHWFNPLVWILLKYFFIDMELACDAGVLKNLDGGSKKKYAEALLSCSLGKNHYASAFRSTKTKLRIERILSYKKLTFLSGLCFAVLFIVIAVTIVTNGVGR